MKAFQKNGNHIFPLKLHLHGKDKVDKCDVYRLLLGKWVKYRPLKQRVMQSGSYCRSAYLVVAE
jgi:hypothetical protein